MLPPSLSPPLIIPPFRVKIALCGKSKTFFHLARKSRLAGVRSPFVRPVTVNPSLLFLLLRLRNYKFGKPRSFPDHVGCSVACAWPAICVSRNLWLKSPLPLPYIGGPLTERRERLPKLTDMACDARARLPPPSSLVQELTSKPNQFLMRTTTMMEAKPIRKSSA